MEHVSSRKNHYENSLLRPAITFKFWNFSYMNPFMNNAIVLTVEPLIDSKALPQRFDTAMNFSRMWFQTL